ncbi:Uncharacterised protein [Mycobacteroides abscessus subsp. bolletii]|uniref:hypothetical protein n=1 Tax=Mycobacteroides abscessus TaxID=36809 RepID=UPI000926ED59|nr:hypothetical protein [Mycobacteroides abscessus]MDO3333396.1 hypothetical protein [Mycobacteroides abscessus subsp. bolletii]SHQ75371.1 Uncharacterised protein [Mycobacteroides abscessus subsp. bolletii]SHS19876.1 Uncharacterised protein [Mycobacteroides abscessus subsp. bolletii]SHS96793.1 Uncharacterised protein [Mycobacteroides abscessus subsp. bolletii]SHT34358.1 Uncharacterised protein [Mycobacteroides abscessus subsp. bolletii]
MSKCGSVFDRVTMRLLGIGYGPDMPFIHRYDRVMPTIVIACIIGVVGLAVLLVALGPVFMWAFIGLLVLFSAIVILRAVLLSPKSLDTLPAIDRTPRVATVSANEGTDSVTGWPGLYVTYQGRDGKQYEVHLADDVDESWLDRFPIGSTWQVYAFRDTALADTVVFLTEAHDEVLRSGIYLWLGVRGEVHTGQFRKPRPGSPFFGEDSRWEFAA